MSVHCVHASVSMCLSGHACVHVGICLCVCYFYCYIRDILVLLFFQESCHIPPCKLVPSYRYPNLVSMFYQGESSMLTNKLMHYYWNINIVAAFSCLFDPFCLSCAGVCSAYNLAAAPRSPRDVNRGMELLVSLISSTNSVYWLRFQCWFFFLFLLVPLVLLPDYQYGQPRSFPQTASVVTAFNLITQKSQDAA